MDQSEDNKIRLGDISTDVFITMLITVVVTVLYIIWRIHTKATFNVAVIDSGTILPLLILISTVIFNIGDYLMLFSRTRAYNRKVRQEGRQEGMNERDAEWLEWIENGKDPDKIPSKVNPIEKSNHNKKDTSENK